MFYFCYHRYIIALFVGLLRELEYFPRIKCVTWIIFLGTLNLSTRFELDQCTNNGDLLSDRHKRKQKNTQTVTDTPAQYRIGSSTYKTRLPLKTDILD